MTRDDRAVVYLNGAEVFRSNLPTGAVNHLTLASNAALPADETTTYYTTDLAASQLVPGWNLLAVEVHQSSTNSSDLSFDLALTASPPPPAPALSLVTTASAPTFTWPDWAGAFALHTTTNLSPPAAWTPVTNTAVLTDNQWRVTLIPETNGVRFYRLQAP